MERESSVKISATVYKQLEEQTKTVAYTDNGTYNVSPDPGYWLSNVNVEVHVDQNLSVISELSAVISGLNDQIANISTLSVTENGTYIPEPDTLGWNNVEVNVEGKITLVNGTKLTGSKFTEVPSRYDFSDITDFSDMFSGCKNIITIPQINTSNGTDFNYMFGSCSKLNTIPQIDTSNGTDFGGMFISCGDLITIPQLDTNKVTKFSAMFQFCYKLESIPQLDFTSAKTMDWMFYECKIITFVPELDTSNVTRMDYAFSGCTKLPAITLTDVSKCTNFASAFGACYELADVKIGGSINKNIDFSYSTKLTYDSVKSILTACSNTTNTTSKTLKFKITLTDQDGELDALIATCTSKGWTITGLTLN